MGVTLWAGDTRLVSHLFSASQFLCLNLVHQICFLTDLELWAVTYHFCLGVRLETLSVSITAPNSELHSRPSFFFFNHFAV